MPTDVLLLTDAQTDWLRAKLPGVVDALDLEKTYSFPHALNVTRRAGQVVADRDFLWQLLFYDEAGTCVLDAGMPLARRVLAALPLWGRRGTGPVAFNATFKLKENCRKQGFARIVYAQEGDLYRRWGIREIQMMATGDGPAVWMRREFGFQPKDPGALGESFIAWASRRGRREQPPMHPADYPVEFLREREGLLLYKAVS